MSNKKTKKPVKKAVKKIVKKRAAVSAGKSGLQPLGDRVLVRPLTSEEMSKTTSFGIIIPDTVEKEKSDRGIVVAVGPGKRNESGVRMPVEVPVGAKVLYTKPWSDPVKVEGAEHYLISESDILAILQ